jgi:hypothetical protein
VWSAPLLAASLQPLKGLLWAIAAQRAAPAVPGDVERFLLHEPTEWACALGFVARGREAVRVDVWEREAHAMARSVRPVTKVRW